MSGLAWLRAGAPAHVAGPIAVAGVTRWSWPARPRWPA